mmetsp:Transcript_5937/g.14088  ORF Transcript_5937/g.14088 Transcript_5937/m.14088 type:complete len:359 (-) Transcript_5937:50-1126(-)
MSTLFWYGVYAAAALGAPLAVLLAVVFVLALVRSMGFKRRRGWLAEQVPHSLDLELYHSCSVDMDAQKVRCCLAEKGVEFKERELDLGFFGTFEHLEDDMLRVNPNGTQPTLVHQGHPVIGVEEIISYIEEHVSGPPMFPPTNEERQNVIRWIHTSSQSPVPTLVDEHGQPKWTLGMATRVLSIPAISAATKPPSFSAALWAVLHHPNPLPEFPILPQSLTRHLWQADNMPSRKASRMAFSVLVQNLADLEEQLASSEREFLVGETFTLADVCMIANLSRLERLGILELVLGDKHPKTREYWGRVKRRESFGPSFQPKPSSPWTKALGSSFARFRKKVAEQGLVGAFQLDDNGEEEED